MFGKIMMGKNPLRSFKQEEICFLGNRIKLNGMTSQWLTKLKQTNHTKTKQPNTIQNTLFHLQSKKRKLSSFVVTVTTLPQVMIKVFTPARNHVSECSSCLVQFLWMKIQECTGWKGIYQNLWFPKAWFLHFC